jgi:CHAT domain-containing protein
MSNNKFNEVIAYLEPAVRSLLAFGIRDQGAAYTAELLAFSMMQTRRFEDAVALFRRAFAYRQGKSLIATKRGLFGARNYANALMQLGQTSEWISVLRELVRARLRFWGRETPASLETETELASALAADGVYRDAEELLLSVQRRQIARTDVSLHQRAMTQSRLAFVYIAQGRLAEAEVAQQTAVALFRSRYQRFENRERVSVKNQFESSPVERIIFEQQGLARIYIQQGRSSDALMLSQQNVDAAVQYVGSRGGFTEDARRNLADALAAQGQLSEALKLYRSVERNFIRWYGDDVIAVNQVRQSMASVERRLGAAEHAVRLMRHVLDSNRRDSGADHPGTLISAYELAMAEAEAGDLTAADNRLAQTAASQAELLGNAHPDTLRSLSGLVRVRLSPARAGAALAPARLLLAGAAERRRSRPSDVSDDPGGEGSQESDWFNDVADALWENEGASGTVPPEALLALQESLRGPESRAVAKNAAYRAAEREGPALRALIEEREQQQSIVQAANQQFGQNAGNGDEESTARLRRMASAREQAQSPLVQIDVQIRDAFPKYFSLLQAPPVELGRLQAALGPADAFLIVVPTSRGTHVVAVTREALRWIRSSWNRDRVAAAVRKLRLTVGAPVPRVAAEERHSRDTAFDRTTAYQLYRELLEPVAPILSGKRRLFLAPGGALASLPFSLLVTAPPAGQDDDSEALRETPWLIDGFAIAQVPSVQSFVTGADEASPGAPTDPFQGFGNPATAGPPVQRSPGGAPLDLARRSRTRSGELIADTSQLMALPQLPGTEMELRRVAAIFNAGETAMHMRAAFTETAVRSADLSRTKVLLFSTHALTANEATGVGESGLVLTPPRDATPIDDGYLAASEVAGLRLNSDWVILSACNTATGDGLNGEGLSGLARAFLYAGSRTLLASHWPVSDEVAPILISRMLELHRGGAASPEALRQAMQEVRMNRAHDSGADSWANPFFWAPFVLIGTRADMHGG